MIKCREKVAGVGQGMGEPLLHNVAKKDEKENASSSNKTYNSDEVMLHYEKRFRYYNSKLGRRKLR